MYKRLSLAIQRNDSPIVIDDSLTAVTMIQRSEEDRSVYASLVKEIKHSRGLRETCITHVIRSQNKVSECLARIERRIMAWIGPGPPKVLELVCDDCKDIVIE